MPGMRKPRQSDVAKLAGVSQAMVSYVLNGSANITIPDETRRRILDAIEQLGYVPDRSARNLRMRKTNTIAVIIPDITNPYHPAFARGVQDVAEKHGYDLFVYNTDGLPEKETKILQSVMQSYVDGIIGVFFHLSVEDLRPLVKRNVAVVRTAGFVEPPSDVAIGNLYLDNTGAACTAVEYLIGKNHTRIAHIAGIAGTPPAVARIDGYRQALAKHGLLDSVWIEPGDFSVDSGYEAMQKMIANPNRPTAVFASNDLMAIGAMDAAWDAGLSIPDDIAVVGFDNIEAATIVRPRLTTICPNQRKIGMMAAEMLIERIQAKTPARWIWEETPYELIVRQSA